jgi:hypothetical protein
MSLSRNKLYANQKYMEDVRYVGQLDLPWDKLKGKNIMLSGATGMIGSFLIDVIFDKNRKDDLDCTVYALGRNEERAKARFGELAADSHFVFIPYDVKMPFDRDDLGRIDFVLHLASNTHPMQYATDPIGTVTTNIIGAQNMLDIAVEHKAARFAFASSNEIYGENRGDTDFFDEDYCGFINSNTLRAGYPESKRCSEALCQAYKFGKLVSAYERAFAEEIGIYGSSYTNTMMVELGERLYFAAGSDKNIKLTTKDDLEMFKAYLKSDKDNWLK